MSIYQYRVPKINLRLAVSVIAITTLASTARPQSAGDMAGVSTDSAYRGYIRAAITTPLRDLPGHDKGARTSAEVEPTDELEEADWFGGDPWWLWNRVTGVWGDFRRDLAAQGIEVEGSWTLGWSDVIDGGADEGSAFQHWIDVNVTLDLNAMWNLEGGTIFLDFLTTNGRSISEHAGDFQGVSNLETDTVDQIAEVWYEQWLADRALRVKIGKIEGNSEFAFVDSASDFMNGSGGISPTVFTIPSAPDTSFGLNLFVYPSETWYLGVGVFDGAAAVDGVRTGNRGPSTFFSSRQSNDFFYIGEAGHTWETLGGLYDGRLAIGSWHHTGTFARFGGGESNGTEGLYAIFEQHLTRRDQEDAEDEGGLFGFLMYGYADPDVSEVEHHLGGGVVLNGTFSGRDDDAAGVFLSHVKLSDQAGFTGDETVLDLFYRFQVTPAISLKPDFQYVFSPSGDSSIEDATVIGLSVEITF